MNLDDTTAERLIAAADDDVFKLELVGRRLIRWDRHVWLRAHRNTVAMSRPSRRLRLP
jgi:hypothetical protein